MRTTTPTAIETACRLLHLDRRERNAQRKCGHSEDGPDKEVPHAHKGGQRTQVRLACPADSLAVAPQHRTKDGSIIATIMTTHMPRNDAAAPDHACPGIGMPPIDDMDAHHAIVSAALAAKSSTETPRKAR